MEIVTNEVSRALNAQLYYLAVVLTLTLPDICGALESADGHATGARYKAWYDRWLASSYPELNGNDLYNLRCGVLHQGILGHPKMSYSRIVFTIPNADKSFHHNNIMNDALNLDAATFCTDMLQAVLQWYAAKQNDAHVQRHLPRLLNKCL